MAASAWSMVLDPNMLLPKSRPFFLCGWGTPGSVGAGDPNGRSCLLQEDKGAEHPCSACLLGAKKSGEAGGGRGQRAVAKNMDSRIRQAWALPLGNVGAGQAAFPF